MFQEHPFQNDDAESRRREYNIQMAEGGLAALQDSEVAEARRAQQVFRETLINEAEGQYYNDAFLREIMPLVDSADKAEQALEKYFGRIVLEPRTSVTKFEERLADLSSFIAKLQESGQLKMPSAELGEVIKNVAGKELQRIEAQLKFNEPMEYALFFIGNRKQAIDFLAEKRTSLIIGGNFKNQSEMWQYMHDVVSFPDNRKNYGKLFSQNAEMWTQLLGELINPLKYLREREAQAA
jgi:hypothetical protein